MEKEKLTEYQIQISLPAPNQEIAQELGLNNKEKKDGKKG